MSELFAPDRIVATFITAYEWVLANVLVVGNAVQLLVILAAFGVAVLVSRTVTPRLQSLRVNNGLARVLHVVMLLVLPLVWLALLWIAMATARAAAWPLDVLEIAGTLLIAWIAIRLVSQLARNAFLATMFTWTAWTIAALSIVGLLDPMIRLLDSAAIRFGTDPGLRISLYTIAKSTLALVVLLTLAIYVTGLLESRIRTSRALSPSVQVLFAKSLKIVLVTIAVLIAVRSLGIDLTALAVMGGAIGLGIGFGLQRVVANLISGVILLVDKSIKPGDVIAVSGTYGWVTALGGRYVSVVTRDGVEHLIPNEMLMAERVENWTHTHSNTRLKADIGIHYDSDVRKAIELCVEAARGVPRVLEDPAPRCLLIGFGDSSVELQLRFWIADAQNGVRNVTSEILLRIWDAFKEHGIAIPYPQRDVHVRSAEGLTGPGGPAGPQPAA